MIHAPPTARDICKTIVARLQGLADRASKAHVFLKTLHSIAGVRRKPSPAPRLSVMCENPEGVCPILCPVAVWMG